MDLVSIRRDPGCIAKSSRKQPLVRTISVFAVQPFPRLIFVNDVSQKATYQSADGYCEFVYCLAYLILI